MIRFNSPIILGSHDALASASCFQRVAARTRRSLGAMVTKTYTINPRPGNRDPLTAFTADGILVSSGLRNPGEKRMLQEIERYLQSRSLSEDPQLIASISIDPARPWERPELELAHLALNLMETGARMIELNLSCPNTNLARTLAEDASQVYRIVYYLKNELLKQGYADNVVIPKLTGFGCDVVQIALAAESAGADGITLSNIPKAAACYTGVFGRDPDKGFGDPLVGNRQGGMTGSSLGPIIREMIARVYDAVKIPLIATGGCLGGLHSTPEEQLDGLLQTLAHGAVAVEAVTPFYPLDDERKLEAINDLARSLTRFLARESRSLTGITGCVPAAQRGEHRIGEVKKILLVGFGKVGKIHAAIWRQLGCQVKVVDVQEKTLAEARGEYQLAASANLAEALRTEPPDVVDICVPTALHFTVLEKVLSIQENARVIVEKPVTNDPQEYIRLQAILGRESIVNNVMVNENYLFSAVLAEVKKLIVKYGLTNYRIFLEFSKDRRGDEQQGRFVDDRLGAFGIEISHPLALVHSLGGGKRPSQIIHTSYNGGESARRKARLIYLTQDGTLVHVFESLEGEVGGEFGSGDYSPLPQRKMVIEDERGYKIEALFEPLPAKERFLGRVEVSLNGQTVERLDDIPDNNMLASLSGAKRYFEDRGAANPSSLRDGLAITEMLLRSTAAVRLTAGSPAEQVYYEDVQWKFKVPANWGLPAAASFTCLETVEHEDIYVDEASLPGSLLKFRKISRPLREPAEYQRVLQYRENIETDRAQRYVLKEEAIDERLFDKLTQGIKPKIVIAKTRTIWEKNGILIHLDEVAAINGESLPRPEKFLEVIIKDPGLKPEAEAIIRELGLSDNDLVNAPYVEIFSV